jgi:hypothetical protein
MVKKSLYCVPSDKVVRKQKNGVTYHCEISADDAGQEREDRQGSAARVKSEPVSNNDASGAKKCKICHKEFKDLRCLKIHKTKKNHWGTSINNSEEGPRRPTKQHKDIGQNVGQNAQNNGAAAAIKPKRKRLNRPSSLSPTTKRVHKSKSKTP